MAQGLMAPHVLGRSMVLGFIAMERKHGIDVRMYNYAGWEHVYVKLQMYDYGVIVIL